jgi:hypothetical protein
MEMGRLLPIFPVAAVTETNVVAADSAWKGLRRSELNLEIALPLMIVFIVMVFVTWIIERRFFGWAFKVVPPVIFRVVIIAIVGFVVISSSLIAGYLIAKNQ